MRIIEVRVLAPGHTTSWKKSQNSKSPFACPLLKHLCSLQGLLNRNILVKIAQGLQMLKLGKVCISLHPWGRENGIEVWPQYECRRTKFKLWPWVANSHNHPRPASSCIKVRWVLTWPCTQSILKNEHILPIYMHVFILSFIKGFKEEIFHLSLKGIKIKYL